MQIRNMILMFLRSESNLSFIFNQMLNFLMRGLVIFFLHWIKLCFLQKTLLILQILVHNKGGAHGNLWGFIDHCVKSVQMRSYFWSVFNPNTGKYGPEISPYLDTFHTVDVVDGTVRVCCRLN